MHDEHSRVLIGYNFKMHDKHSRVLNKPISGFKLIKNQFKR